MKRILMFKKRIKGDEFQMVDLSLAREMTQKGKNKGLSVRETTRIHAITGIPWETVNREIEETKV
ncbi:MAG: hypothetical protein ABIJ37_03205 [Pseudomonadota bacterium]